ncbi:MAG TPA: hypothetical protein VFW89_08790 [Gemmatimonadaceae bacterium]|nr:hypothetical protein [Gemmatimonadaceae bacterium]
MAVRSSLETDVIQRLRHDAHATLGRDYAALILAAAANARAFMDDAEQYVAKVVEDVQQRFHDEFVDTTWPRCPRHRQHPLWYHGGVWVCQQDGIAVARLGELPGSGTEPTE